MKQRTYALRTRVKRDIVCEFLPPMPARRGRSTPRQKVAIVYGGMPSYPGKSPLPEFLSKKGYWAFVPRYRGTWESGGSFLARSPHLDIIDVIDTLSRGFKDLWSGKTYRIARPEIYLIGTSFGGAAAILASRDRRVKKTIALSPVTDWRVGSKTEPIDRLGTFTRDAFGEGYRGKQSDWNKLKTGRFYNPMHEAESIDGKKLLIIHPQDDKTVRAGISKKFAAVTSAKIIVPKRGGHLGTSSVMTPEIWKAVGQFLK